MHKSWPSASPIRFKLDPDDSNGAKWSLFSGLNNSIDSTLRPIEETGHYLLALHFPLLVLICMYRKRSVWKRSAFCFVSCFSLVRSALLLSSLLAPLHTILTQLTWTGTDGNKEKYSFSLCCCCCHSCLASRVASRSQIHIHIDIGSLWWSLYLLLLFGSWC